MIAASPVWFDRQAVAEALQTRAAVPAVMLFAVALLFIPLPPALMDVTVGFNLLVAVTMLLATMDANAVLSLRAFPSILLITTIFRLSVSVSTARGILAHGEAGEIVRNFGEFVVGGELIAGLIVFLIISLVQFLVVSKGGERIAEVSARFTLDAMPGRQMSIDVDLKNGDLSKEEAAQKRLKLERESQFFGSMDGAMRFVKGDSIATMLTVFISLLGGLAIGSLEHGLSLAAAAKKYLILSVGDGLVAQIPSMLSTIAAGVLVTRVSDDKASGGLNADVMGVLGGQTRSLFAAAAAIGGLAFVPGFPTLSLLPLAGATAAATGYVSYLKRRATQGRERSRAEGAKDEALPASSYGDSVVLRTHPSALRRLAERGLKRRLDAAAQQRANELGFSVPTLKFRADPEAPEAEGVFYVEGGAVERLDIGEDVAIDALAERLSRRCAEAACQAFGIDEFEQWLTLHQRTMPRLIDSLRQQAPMSTVSEVVRRLLEEGVRLDQPRALFTAVIANIQAHFTVEELLQDVRLAMARQIVGRHLDANGELPVWRFDPAAAERLKAATFEPANLGAYDASASAFEALVSDLRALQAGFPEKPPVLVVADAHRAELAQRLAARGLKLTVLSHAEAAAAPRHRHVDASLTAQGTLT